jgi:hypothetical protein
MRGSPVREEYGSHGTDTDISRGVNEPGAPGSDPE